ncbi:MAG: tetratricopeptide repeat protein [Sedimentisphaerales bacterium]|nr:tetratricopeptide repeat protein [Sedimentisphaerales bacterium]
MKVLIKSDSIYKLNTLKISVLGVLILCASASRIIGQPDVSTNSFTRYEVLSDRIEELVKELEYSDDVARDFADMVLGWSDTEKQTILAIWNEKLTKAREECEKGNISKSQLSAIEKNIINDLTYWIKKEIAPDVNFFDLTDIIKAKRAQCVGYAHILYILGNSVGLNINAINVTERVSNEFTKGHVADIVTLTNGQKVMVDVGLGFVSKSFILDKEFSKAGNYWELKDKKNPLEIHKRFQIVDRNGLLAQLLLKHGNDYLKSNQFNKAISEFTKAIKISPKYPDPYINRGGIYGTTGETNKALSDLNKAIEIDPKSAFAYNNLALIHLNSGKFAQSISNCNTAIEISPKYPDPYLIRGSAYYTQKEFTKSISDCTRAIELNPNLAAAYYIRGAAYVYSKPEEAKKDFDKALDLNPALKPSIKKISDSFELDIAIENK